MRGESMTETKLGRAHLIAGGFPPGSAAGHDHDYARLRLLGLLAEQGVAASIANDFADVEKWLPSSRLLITYVAGPYPDAAQCRAMQRWLEAGGRWLGLHGTSGGRAERVEGARQRRTVKTEHHALLGSYFLTHPPICKIRVDVKGGDSPLTRVLGYTRQVGQGGVAYLALGHCHNPAIRAARSVDPTDTTPLTFRGSWESDAFMTLLRNTIGWGVGT